jgi:hypothetical protein
MQLQKFQLPKLRLIEGMQKLILPQLQQSLIELPQQRFLLQLHLT